jgi:hypothetical protein
MFLSNKTYTFECVIYSFTPYIANKMHTKMPAQSTPNIYNRKFPGENKNLSLHLYYSGHLRVVNAAGLLTRLDFKTLLSKLLHMQLD